MVGMKRNFDFTPADQGTQRYIYELVKNFAIMKHPGIDIYQETLKALPSVFLGFSQFIYGPLKDLSKYDIIHEFADNIPRIRYGKAISVHTIFDLHVLLPSMRARPEYRTVRGFLGLNLLMTPGIKSTLKADYLITDSTQATEECVRYGFDKNRIFMTSLGVDRRFTSKKLKGKKHNKKTFKVGYIGSFNSAKNLSMAIKAFKKTSDQNMSFELWGSKKAQYDKLVDLSKGDRRIMFKGFAPEDKLVETYDSFDVFVHPSIYEGFGLPILEAQARGLPVIIYKKSKTPKEVRRYCLEAEDESHMAQLFENLKSNGYNEKSRRKAIEYARSFTWEKTARNTLEVYKIIQEKEHLV